MASVLHDVRGCPEISQVGDDWCIRHVDRLVACCAARSSVAWADACDPEPRAPLLSVPWSAPEWLHHLGFDHEPLDDDAAIHHQLAHERARSSRSNSTLSGFSPVCCHAPQPPVGSADAHASAARGTQARQPYHRRGSGSAPGRPHARAGTHLTTALPLRYHAPVPGHPARDPRPCAVPVLPRRSLLRSSAALRRWRCRLALSHRACVSRGGARHTNRRPLWISQPSVD